MYIYTHIYIYTYLCTYINLYIYVYMERQRVRARERERERERRDGCIGIYCVLGLWLEGASRAMETLGRLIGVYAYHTGTLITRIRQNQIQKNMKNGVGSGVRLKV